MIASNAPLEPSDCFGVCKADHLLGLGRRHPGIDGLFQRDAIHRLEYAVKSQRHDRQSCTNMPMARFDFVGR